MAYNFNYYHYSMRIITFVIILLLVLMNDHNEIDAYSSGAPNSRRICESMIPGHGNNQQQQQQRQNNQFPYKLNIRYDSTSSTTIMIIDVELESIEHHTFAGFMIQSRKLMNTNNNDELINDDGYFATISNNTITKSCLSQIQNTWTHSNGEPKTIVKSRWILNNANKYNGSFYFKATVVQVKQAYWNNIKSDVIYLHNGRSIDSMTYSKLIDNDNNNNNNNNNDYDTNDNDNGNGLNYKQCENRLCIGLPNDDADSNCVESKSCIALMSVWKDNADDDDNNFSLQAKPSSPLSSNLYYSMAFSDDNRMGNDFVVDCLADQNGKVQIDLSENIGKRNRPLSASAKNNLLKNQQTQFNNGIVECNWKFNRKQFTISNRDYDLEKRSYFVFLASGSYDMNDNAEQQKDYHDQKLRTSETLNFESIKAGSLTQNNDLTVLIRIHGSLMLIAWFGTVPIAITLARYFKTSWPGSLLCGVQIWFAFHRFLMVVSICLMIIAQICIFYYLQEYRVGLHQILGSIAFIFAILQPIGAMFRPHPGTPKRWLFNWAHWFGGTAGQITAAAAILLASKLKLANLPDSFLYIAILWIFCHVLLHLLFQFHSFCISSSLSHSSNAISNGLKSPDIAMQNLHDQRYSNNNYNTYNQNQSSLPPSSSTATVTKSSKLRYLLLFIYILLIGLLVIILTTLIAMPSMVKKFL